MPFFVHVDGSAAPIFISRVHKHALSVYFWQVDGAQCIHIGCLSEMIHNRKSANALIAMRPASSVSWSLLNDPNAA